MRSKNKKEVVVNRKFLLDLATKIYDGKNKKFLYLCNGTLQNGPCPIDGKRPMHCGLGELYFEMTGDQPQDTGVNEEDVISIAIERSTISDDEVHVLLQKQINKLDKDLVDILDIGITDEAVERYQEPFRDALDAIPKENDQVANGDYKERSKRVAAQFRKAAALLPK